MVPASRKYNSPVLPSVILLGIPGMRVIRCFLFAIGCRSWNSGDDRFTLNVTRIGIIYLRFSLIGGSMVVACL
eukprot:scaffold127424_cov41-Attheya_sp.AAC.1